MRDLISLIQKYFPDKQDRIARHMASDSDFYVMCQDYEACLKAKDYWVHSNAPEADERAREYQTLIEELEGEIAACLQLAITP